MLSLRMFFLGKLMNPKKHLSFGSLRKALSSLPDAGWSFSAVA
jgi:hypothetical protein